MDFLRYAEELETHRGDRGPENLVVLPQVDSTNRLARAIIAEYEAEAQPLHPLLLLAFEQTGGRGRRGREWSSPRGKGVYATRVLTVADPAVLSTLPLLVGIGLCRALAPHLPAPCRLKWPNDLLVETAEGRRKIGGVLVEALIRPGEVSAVIVGFGVNHSHESGDLPQTGTSLLQESGNATLADLTWDLVDGVERELAHLGDAAYAVESYRGLSVHRPGERVSLHTGEEVIEGAFAGFDEQGRLRLETETGERALSAGEIIES